MNYALHLLIYVSIYLIVAISVNMIVGYGGLLTLAHAAFFALGCYVYALLTLKAGLGFVPAAVCAFLLSALLSLLVSLPSWRLRGDFFVMVTLAVQALAFSVANNWSSPTAPLGTLHNMTNGPFGIPGIPRPEIAGIQFDTMSSMLVLSCVVAGLAFLLVYLLLGSPWGRLQQAVRDDDLAARGLGKNVRILRVQLFAVACGLAAVAGCLYAGYVGYVDPSQSSLDMSILFLCMAIVGGLGNLYGPVVGALILVAIPELLRFAEFSDSTAAELRLMAYGLLLVVLMHYRPQGMAGTYRID